MNKKILNNLIFILLFAFTTIQTNANISQAVEFESYLGLIIQTDTLDKKKEISPIVSIKPNEMISKQVKTWSYERFITLGPPAFIDTAAILYIVNGKKKENINLIKPEQIKSIQFLKVDDIPKKYKRRGITGIIKISTKKKDKSSKK